MSSVFDKYEVIVGLEVHAQLSTNSKMYCGDSAAYGAPVNTQVSPLSLGHPGTLPRVNKRAIEYAVKIGLATNCAIRRENQFARKNYFYADLPKGYQITQDKTPLCNDGYLELEINGTKKRIGIERIHMEEDAGKSIHDQDPYYTLVDLNRAGVPLIEIVSRPDIRSSEEAYQYLTEVRKLVRYLDICDGNMEEGSMRCDANISVRLKGDTKLNARVEVKNMNSMRNVKKAIEFEFERQVMMMENGERLEQETRGFDALKGITLSQRSKEHAHDYRYFPEPDLPPVFIEESYVNDIRAAMPKLSAELMNEYINIYHLPEYDARVITDDKDTAFYFNDLLKFTKNYKAAANWLLGPIKSYLNENALEITDLKISAKTIAELITVIDGGKTNFATASSRVFPELISNPDEAPLAILERLNLLQSSDEGLIKQLAEEVLAKYPEKVAEYKGGKVGLMGLFVGEVMKASKGKADPKLTNKVLNDLLNPKTTYMDINKHIIDQRITKIIAEKSEWFEPDIIVTENNRREITQKRLSKAFLILSVSSYLGVDMTEAENMLTDGGNDAGIDAIDIGSEIDNEFTVTIFQAKYVFDLEKDSNFPANSIQRLIGTINSMFDLNRSLEMNDSLKVKVEEIRSLIEDGNIPRVRCVFVNNGKSWNEEGNSHINNAGFPKDQVEFEHFNHNDIVNLIKTLKPIETTLKLTGESIKEDFKFKRVIVGKMNVREIATLFEVHGDGLLEMNVRKHLGLSKSRVNNGIQNTLLSDKKDNFYFYNNGITMICSQFSYNGLQKEDWQVNVKGLQIINGGQSCKTIQQVITEHPDADYSQVYVLVRLYELPEGNDNLITDVTIATNSQNPVDLRDLRANDDVQKNIEQDIKGLGFVYKRKKDQAIPSIEVIIPSVAAEAIYSIWKFKPYLAKFKKEELFGKYYEDVFDGIIGSQVVLAVLIFRFCDNQRRKQQIISQYPHAPYSNYFISMIIGQIIMRDQKRVNNKFTLSHNNFAQVINYFELNKDELFDRSNKILIDSLDKLYPQPNDYKTIPARRLSATFRSGALMQYINLELAKL